MKRLIRFGLAAAAPALLSSRAAEAHIIASRLGDFYTGALHPLTDPQDIVLWLALGALAGSLGPQRGRWLVPLFPLGLLFGLALGRTFGVTGGGAVVDSGFVVLLGLLIAAAVQVPTFILATLGFAVAALRGAVNAEAINADTNLPLFAFGLALVGYAAITLIAAATVAFRQADRDKTRGWRSIAIRAAGSWIAAIGLMMGGFALAS